MMEINEKEYLKSIMTLFSGSMIAQMVTMICSPILTRICTPDELGLYALVNGAIGIFGTVMSFRYEMCIVFDDNNENVLALIKLSLIICSFMSFIIAIGYYFYFKSRTFENHSLVLGLICGFLVFLLGIINIVTSYNNRNKDYILITRTYVWRIVCQNAGNILSAFLGLGAIGLSFSQLVGYCVGVKSQVRPLRQYKKQFKNVNRFDIMRVAKLHRKQPLMSCPAAFTNGLSYTLLNYFIEAMFSTVLVGYYSISFRILGLPLTMISNNVSKVFMEKASRTYSENGEFKELYKTTVFVLFVIAIPIVVILVCFSPILCEFAFGKGWHIAGEYIKILAPMFALRFIAGGVNCAGIITNKQQFDLIIQITLTICSILIFFIAKTYTLPIDRFLQMISITFSIIYAVYIYLFWICAKGKLVEMN